METLTIVLLVVSILIAIVICGGVYGYGRWFKAPWDQK
jgi:hypothetical protein